MDSLEIWILAVPSALNVSEKGYPVDVTLECFRPMTVEFISLPLSCFAFAGASAWASSAALLPEDEQPTIHSMTAAERISLFITFHLFYREHNMNAGLILDR
jgi:2-methylisocitrate lyase-like PEP mutase family enzyme